MKNRCAILVCVLAVLALRLPFLNQPIQGDDVYYLEGAQHAQIDPLHPHHARYAFQGAVVDMRGHPHPPFNAMFLGAVLAAVRDVREPVFHAAYILFSLIAVMAALSLASRFSPHPLLATLMFMAVPAFVVNGNSLEADVPFLAFWMASVALFVSAEERRSAPRLSLAALAAALAAMTAYQSVFLAGVLGAYLYLRKSRWMPAWAMLLVPFAVIGGWQLWERSAGGAMPGAVLVGYFREYALQTLAAKLRNAGALTVHMAWLVFPAIAATAFRDTGKRVLAFIAVAGAALAWVDANPLFWASWIIGAMVLVWMARAAARAGDAEERFLAAWVALFFSGAIAVFFAGSERYLLPAAAPVAILATRKLAGRTALLAAGCAASFALSLLLAVENYQHWEACREFVQRLAPQMQSHRTWVNAEWGLRFYAEAEGGLPLLRTTAPQPGDIVLRSALGGFDVPANGPRTLLASAEIRPWVPLRIIGLGVRSGYSTAAMGLRPFDISTKPVDRLTAELVVERRPTLAFVPMNAPEAPDQIVSGLFNLENNAWRWTGRRATVAVRAPAAAAPVEASFYIPDTAPARSARLLVDGRLAAEAVYKAPGAYTLRSGPVKVEGPSATVTLEVDRTFRAPGDERDLGIVLNGIGFRE